MENFHRAVGSPPYKLQSLIDFANEACQLWEQMISGVSSFDRDHIVSVIESLEILYTLLSNTSDRNGQKDIPDLNPPELDRFTRLDIPSVIMGLKDYIFNNSEDAEPSTDSCKCCRWALERLYRGTKEPSANPIAIQDRLNACCFLWAQGAWPDIPALQQRLSLGCEFCGFLRECVTESLVSQNSRPHDGIPTSGSIVSLWISFDWTKGWPNAAKGVALEGEKDETVGDMCFATVILSLPGSLRQLHQQQIMKLRMESTDSLTRSELCAVSPIFVDALSPGAVEVMRSHLRLPDPREGDKSSFIPKRLMQLAEDNGESYVKLVDTDTFKDFQVPAYAALSYCWGTPEQARHQLRLLNSTAEVLYDRIDQNQLPQVASDAIAVCRSLGIHHLWIDALCIRQDNITDWELHSSAMGHVYDSALITICAIASNSCIEGFLERQKTSPPCFYSSSRHPGKRGEFRLRPVPLHDQMDSMIWTPHPLVQDLGTSRWIKRGWTFQEKSYGNRKLYFGKTMWHCQRDNLIVSEVLAPRDDPPSGVLDSIPSIDLKQLMEPLNLLQAVTIRHSLESEEGHAHQLYEIWGKLTSKFSLLDWTNEADLLPGLSGLARTFQEALNGDSYLAGHWRGDLACSLVWEVRRVWDADEVLSLDLDSVLSKCGISRNPRSVPSWSWASGVMGGMEPMIYSLINTKCRARSHLRPEFTLCEDPRIVTQGVNPFGRLESVTLRLNGKVIPVGELKYMFDWMDYPACFLTTRGEGEDSCLRGLRAMALVMPDWDDYWPDISPEEHSKLRLLLISSCCSDDSSRKGHEEGVNVDLIRPDSFKQELYKFAYHRTYAESLSDNPESATTDCHLCQSSLRRDVWGLLIYPADTPGQWYRVGAFMSRAKHGGSAIFENIKEEVIELV